MERTIKKLKRRLQEFSPRDSNCPICHREFRDEYNCQHSISEAKQHLQDKIRDLEIRQIVQQEMNRVKDNK